MKFFFWSLALIVPSTVVAQNRDPSPAVPPGPASAVTTTTGQANASEPAPSATGAPAPANNKPIALKIVGSNVKNLKGEYLGLIEGVALNPESKQIEYALLNTEYPTNSGRVTPVPWQNLSYVWDQGQVGGSPGTVQLFRLDVDKGRLAQAPKIDRNQLAQLLMPPFRQQLVAFYGNVPEGIGATGTEVASASGQAAGGPGTASTAATDSGQFAGYAGGFGTVGPGGFLLTDNSSTNSLTEITNIINTTNIVNSTNILNPTNIVNTGTNVVDTGTNVASGTNISNSGTNTIASGGTNTFQPTNSPFPGGNFTNNGSMAGNGNVTNGAGPIGSSNRFARRTELQGRFNPGDNTGGTGAGASQTSGAGASVAPNSPRRPWAPPTTVIIPGQQTVLPNGAIQNGSSAANPNGGGLTLPPPPGALQLPNPVGPLPFPTPSQQGSLPPVASPPGAVPPAAAGRR